MTKEAEEGDKRRRQPMRERILATADRLFYERGIRAVGVDTIAAEAGISKRSLYDHFPSKDELVTAYLLGRSIPRPGAEGTPIEQIRRAFDRLERAAASPGFRGCAFVNAVAELGGSSPGVCAAALAFKEERRVWFRDRLQQMPLADPDLLATQLSLLFDGAIAAVLVRQDPAMVRAARAAAETLIDAAGTETPGTPTPCALL